jgi:hypothetical protein
MSMIDMGLRSLLALGCCVLACGALACGGDPPGDGDFQASSSPPIVPARVQAFLDDHRLPYLERHGLDVAQAEFRRELVAAFDLSAAALEILNERGFVVVEAPSAREGKAAGPVDTYYRIFAADLPVFVTADSVLHAWHRSYDELLERTEAWILRPALAELMADLVRRLDPARQDEADARTYLRVAEALLSIDDRDAVVEEPVRAIVDAIDARGFGVVELAGRQHRMDLSQFQPRGHYTRDDALRAYFRAMMWLGRAELVLHDPRGLASEREERAALALVRALAASPARPIYEAIEDFLAAQVGAPNGLSPRDLLAICADIGRDGCAGPSDALTRAYEAIEPAAHASRLESDETSAAISRAVVALRFFPQRFAYDAWVTAKTTSPELPSLPFRGMASPLDVGVALGAHRAAAHLFVELMEPGREALPATLTAMRRTLREVPPVALAPSVYNHWLAGLMAFSEPRIGAEHPRVLRTAAWHDRQLEAVLGSWTELRHDTILLVEQSLGRIGCQYPRGYVEPVPDLYRALSGAAARLAALYAADGALAEHGPHARHFFRGTRAFLESFQETMQRLAALASLELAGRPMSDEDLAFLKQTVDRHHEGYAGMRSYDGWYPRLFWTPNWRADLGEGAPSLRAEGAISRPVVADVHTDAIASTVLQVGVADFEMLVVAIDDPAGAVALYAGPVTSFHSFERPVSERMSDEAWRDLLARERPPRPPFARSYRP